MELAAMAVAGVVAVVLLVRYLRRAGDAADVDTLAENAGFAAEKVQGLLRGGVRRDRADARESGDGGGSDGGGDGGG